MQALKSFERNGFILVFVRLSMLHSLATKRRIILATGIILVALLYTFKNTSFFIRSLATLSVVALVYAIDHYFDAKFTTKHYAMVYIMAIGGFLLSPLYFVYPSYDKIQHFIFPILFSALVFHLVSKLRLHRKWELFFTFAIVVGSLALFELGEYGLDYFFDLKLQGVFLRSITGIEKYEILMDRIDDTMVDLMWGIGGALTYWFVNLARFIQKRYAKKQRALSRNSKVHRAR